MRVLRGVLPVAVLLSLAAVVGAEECQPGDKIRVVLIDGQNNHNWRATTPVLKRHLEQAGRFTVDISTNLKAGEKLPAGQESANFPPDLSRYDVLLSLTR